MRSSEIKKIWFGLRFFKRSFQGWWVIASYHHPDSITWRWCLSLDHRYGHWKCWPKIGPSWNMGKWWTLNGNISFWFTIPLLGVFGFSTQEHMWRK